MIIVHHLDDSRSHRILWLLEELDVPYEVVTYARDPRTRLAPAALKAIHPLGKSPIITDGAHVVAESGAIFDYILRTYGDGRLVPDTSEGAYDDFCYWMHAAEGSAMPALIIRLNVAGVDPQASVLPRLDEEIANHLSLVEEMLGSHDYLIGQGLSAIDIMLSFFAEVAAARLGINGFPKVDAWIRRFQARPAYKRALARGGPYGLLLDG